ncbi:IclR family transcriptional regulator [Sciscionella marina]|uniref:IclR family transcriptional regulator n=1 Tax=Sciscionella marina TaxID=508770 RepID=UPI0003722CB6|nr:IclR family transcriptional regulator [Sciscionella marina]
MIQSVDRAIRALGLLRSARGSHGLSLAQLAAGLELAPSTVHGIVKTLQAHGLVVQEPRSGHYRLGPELLKLGNVYLGTLELRSRSVTWSAELARRTGFAVRIGARTAGEVMIVHHEPRPDGSRQMAEAGLTLPLHATALGKAVLAFTGEEPGELPSMTADTVTERASLAEQLDQVRARALAAEQEEAVLGECGLAAPIADAESVVGAIGIVVPIAEWPVAESAIAAVREAARTISHELGATGWPAAR